MTASQRPDAVQSTIAEPEGATPRGDAQSLLYAIETWFFAPSVYPGDQIPFVW